MTLRVSRGTILCWFFCLKNWAKFGTQKPQVWPTGSQAATVPVRVTSVSAELRLEFGIEAKIGQFPPKKPFVLGLGAS